MTLTDGVQIRSEPLGTVLILGAWNYPVHLVIEPLIGAIAAGESQVLNSPALPTHKTLQPNPQSQVELQLNPRLVALSCIGGHNVL